MTVPVGLEEVLKVDPEIMHGALCFAGTRVPLTVFLDNIKEGESLDRFLANYPSVTREQTQAVLDWENRAILVAAGLNPAV